MSHDEREKKIEIPNDLCGEENEAITDKRDKKRIILAVFLFPENLSHATVAIGIFSVLWIREQSDYNPGTMALKHNYNRGKP